MLKGTIIRHTQNDIVIENGKEIVEITTPIDTTFNESDEFIDVSQGQTLRAVAWKVYGDARLYWIIAEYNNIIDPFTIFAAGTRLRYPTLKRVQSELL